MACLLVPAAEALVVTAVTKIVEKKEKETVHTQDSSVVEAVTDSRIPFTKKLKWLSNLLWGGSALLAFEHVWHGEIVPYFPFLTAMSNAEETRVMLEEMSTVGVSMAILVSVVWLGMVSFSNVMEKENTKEGVRV